MANLLQKQWFSDRAFYVTVSDADIGSLKSLYTLFDKYLDYMLAKFEETPYEYEIYLILSFLAKTFLWHKQLFDKLLYVKINNL